MQRGRKRKREGGRERDRKRQRENEKEGGRERESPKCAEASGKESLTQEKRCIQSRGCKPWGEDTQSVSWGCFPVSLGHTELMQKLLKLFQMSTNVKKKEIWNK